VVFGFGTGEDAGCKMDEVYFRHGCRFAFALWFAAFAPAVAQLQTARIIILIGPPGSGKTVQANYLHKRYKIPAISMAQVLQQEVNRKSPHGKSLAASLESGELVTDGPANELMKARLLRSDAGRGFILDGYPATEGQAGALDEFLSEHNFPKPIIVVMDAPEHVLRDRMMRRQRADDNPGNIERRLRDYREIGRVVEKWYGPERVVRVDGAGTPQQVALRIATGIEAVESRQGLKVRSSEDGFLKRRQAPKSPPEEKE
jgi:adenylate kinase